MYIRFILILFSILQNYQKLSKSGQINLFLLNLKKYITKKSIYFLCILKNILTFSYYIFSCLVKINWFVLILIAFDSFFNEWNPSQHRTDLIFLKLFHNIEVKIVWIDSRSRTEFTFRLVQNDFLKINSRTCTFIRDIKVWAISSKLRESTGDKEEEKEKEKKVNRGS